MASLSVIFESLYYLLLSLFNTAVEFYYSTLKAPQSDVAGQVFLITGANTGIGKDAARQIALMNPKKVYITSRSVEKGKTAVADLRRITGKDNIELLVLDLDSLASVQKVAEEIKQKEEKIDVLILNAGVGHTTPGSRTSDGFDQMYQSNHLGHHLLLELLLDTIKSASKPGKPARVIVTSSMGHFFCTEQNLAELETSGKGMAQYAATKMLNLLMVRYYSKRLGGDVIFNGVHPGGVYSDFLEKFPDGIAMNLARRVGQKMFRTVESGAATTVFVATDPFAGKINGKYWSNMTVLTPHRIAQDDRIAEKYMQKSFEEIKIKNRQ